MMKSSFYIIGFIVYTSILIVIGYLATRKNSNGKSFLDGGKSVNYLLLIGTLGATMIGTGSSIGATANGYQHGWGGSVLGLGLALGMMTMLIFVPLRKYNLSSITEEAQFYYGGNKTLRIVLSVVFFIIEIVWVGSHINGGAKYLSFVTGLESVPAKTIITIAFLGYAFFGGFLSVIWTDTIQFGVIIIGFISVVISAYISAGGAEAIQSAYIAAGNPGALGFYGLGSYGVLSAISLLLSTFYGVIAVPCFHTRIFSAKNLKIAKTSVVTSSIISLAFSFLPSILGMCAFTIAMGKGVVLETPDYAFSYIATTVLEPFMGLLFLIAGLSATLSSADSDLMAGVTILIEDLYISTLGKYIPQEKYKSFSRRAMIIAVGIGYLLSLGATDIISYTTNVVGSLLPGMGVCMLMGRLWKRSTWQGGLSCILCSLIFGVLYLCIPSLQTAIIQIFGGPAIPVTIIAVCAGTAGSFMTPANTMTEQDRLQAIQSSR